VNGSFTSPEGSDCVLVAGVSGGESVVPTTRFGRVRKNRIASNNPQSEKRPLPKRVNCCETVEPLKYIQRAMLMGNTQKMYTAG
jgi:hypothetical protein